METLQQVRQVRVNGNQIDLGTEMGENEIREMLETYGIAKNLDGTTFQVQEGVGEFVQQRGANGNK